ncbi:MAG: acetyl-CoA carboxylase, biotin carboxyl carrier protein [Cyanobacteria bacterium SW_9_44_58]|nr:MAG: acetyl-CoA carboxylase, biotin carboxyl carrier protein [Cyanobacteria bacterium SW_9_44_58]
MSIDFNEIRELLNAISQADIAEFSLKNEQFELTVRKGLSNVSTETIVQPTPQQPQSQPATAESSSSHEETTAPASDQSEWEEITSPIVGTFYEAPAPGEAPFVKVGDQIQANQTVCIVEAMKIMNEIEAEVSGEVMEITVKNGEPVEYGQTLMRIKPDQ